MHTHGSGGAPAPGGREHTHGAGGHSHGAGAHAHGHGAGEENYTARPHPEQVVLDIGGDIGALIVHTDAAMLGVEVEISPTGLDAERSHKDVLQREIHGRPAYTAVFDKLPEGTYTLWVDNRARIREVAIQGATVAELDWSSEPSA